MNGLRSGRWRCSSDAFAYPAFEQITQPSGQAAATATRGRVVRSRSSSGFRTVAGIGGVEHHCDSLRRRTTRIPRGCGWSHRALQPNAYSLLRQANRFVPTRSSSSSPSAVTGPRRRSCWPGSQLRLDQAAIRRPVTDLTPHLVRRRSRYPSRPRGGPRRLGRGRGAQRRGSSICAGLSPFDDATVGPSPCAAPDGAIVGPRGESVLRIRCRSSRARLSEQCFHFLEAPILRGRGLRHPLPSAESGTAPLAEC